MINFDTCYKCTLSKTSCSCYLGIEGSGDFFFHLYFWWVSFAHVYALVEITIEIEK